MKIDKVVAHIDDYDWQYPRGKTDQDGVIRWKTLISADRTPTADLIMGILEVPPGASMSTHYHAPAEVYYVYGGCGQLAIDGETRSVREGSVVYVPRDVVHGIENVGDTLLTLMWMFPGDVWADIEYHRPPETE